ncbi:MAG: TlpA family protein disulfide reductase [Rhodospirillaceae bacterium]|nr:TlpA family protein disulfide reductase [Rhodospirillales bacterium]
MDIRGSEEMDRSKQWMRYTRFGLVLALAFAGGAALAWLGANGRLSYTEPRGNPSATGADIATVAAAARAAPRDFVFTDGDGRALRLADFKGKVVLVNLWATWCPPCVAEMPALDALQGKLGQGKLGEPGFQVVAVSLDRGGAPLVKRWFERNRIAKLGVYTAAAGQFEGAVLPTSILLDAQGRVAWQGAGIRDWEGEAVQGVIRAVMAE